MEWLNDVPLDTAIFAWASGRLIALFVTYQLLKWVAKQTPWSGDDELVQIAEDTYKKFSSKGKWGNKVR